MALGEHPGADCCLADAVSSNEKVKREEMMKKRAQGIMGRWPALGKMSYIQLEQSGVGYSKYINQSNTCRHMYKANRYVKLFRRQCDIDRRTLGLRHFLR